MRPAPPLDKTYPGRPDGTMPMGVNLPRDAVRILRKYAPTPRSYGAFLSRLLFEHQAREEERQRLRQQVHALLDAEKGENA
jgi:hypothetical protein